MNIRIYSALLTASLLSACGGGSSSNTISGATSAPTSSAAPTSTPVPAVVALGIWRHSHVDASNGNSLENSVAVLLENGTSAVIDWSNNQINGITVGQYTFANNALTLNGQKEYLPNVMVNPTTSNLKATVNTTNLSINETGSVVNVNFAPVISTAAQLSDVVGSYSGKSYSPNYHGTTEGFTVQADGSIIGSTKNSCTYSGKLTPSNKMNAYIFTLTFSSASCDLNGQTATGIALREPFQNKFIAFGANAQQTQGFYFEGVK